MSILFVLGIMVFLLVLPLLIMFWIWLFYNRPNPLYIRGIPPFVKFLMSLVTAVYYTTLFTYGQSQFDKHFPIRSETKMVCESKTFTWREGIKE